MMAIRHENIEKRLRHCSASEERSSHSSINRRISNRLRVRWGLDPSRVILGGDRLGPNPWKHLAADQAMRRAKAMIEGYARAGFAKLHLDTSMGCAGEPARWRMK